MFELPTEADPGPDVTDFRFEKVNAVTDTKDIVGRTHIFRIEPTGGDWWVPSKSYFRTRLKVVVGMNESKYPAWSTTNQPTAAKDTKQPTQYPLPSQCAEAVLKAGTSAKVLGQYSPTGAAVVGVRTGTSAIANPTVPSIVGVAGETLSSLRAFTGVDPADAVNFNSTATDIDDLQSARAQEITSNGISYIKSFKPFTALKFVEIADCATDAFFDQMSFSVGPVRVETVLYPQLVNVMQRRTKYSPSVNATRFDSMGVFGDEQRAGNRNSNRLSEKTSVFDLLGYSNITITPTQDWKTEWEVSFDVLYVPPLSVFELGHALPSARYEIEFKGAASHSNVINNFFHVTLPGGTGRWYMDKKSTDTSDGPGALEMKGPACALDNRHMDGRGPSLHPGASMFVFEPPHYAGPHFNEVAVSAHFLGRGMIDDAFLKTQNDRQDPGYFISVQCVSITLEAAMASGPLLTDSTFVLQFDQTTPHFLPLAGSATQQSLIFDVDPMANHFMFGFRKTAVTDDPCLQEGHLVTPANTERDLIQYYVSFDMKTRPTSFATSIDLTHPRGAVNEMVRSQINNMTLFANPPETVRSWLKKGPYYAYDWPRDGTSNATRFQLNLFFADSNAADTTGRTMGPHGMFENEMPLVYANPLAFKVPQASVTDNTSWESCTEVPARSNAYRLKNNYGVKLGAYRANDSKTQGLIWYAPRLFYSIYYPASLQLLQKQCRIDADDRVEPTLLRVQNPNNALTDASTTHNAMFLTQSALQTALQVGHNHGSALEPDRGYKGTEHSRPTNMRLADTNNSVVLFQTIPRKFIITTGSGRVIAVRTIDNRS